MQEVLYQLHKYMHRNKKVLQMLNVVISRIGLKEQCILFFLYFPIFIIYFFLQWVSYQNKKFFLQKIQNKFKESIGDLKTW